MTLKGVIKAGTTREKLAKYYNVDISVIVFWLEEIGITHSKTLKPIELARFVAHVGPPDIDIEIRIPFAKVQVYEQGSLGFS